jgi:O-antigen/teichoic acid export membrane protein
MTGIAVTGLVVTQADKVVLSRLVSLDQFGYYALGGVLANGLYTLITPTFASVFPRFSALTAVDDRPALQRLYRRSWVVMAALLVPAGAVISAFAGELLLLWTHNQELSRAAGPFAAVLVIGTVCNGLMNVPYALQLAQGWTSVPLRVNVVLTAIAVPAVIVLARTFGASGAALMWPGVNALYLAVCLPLTHRQFSYVTDSSTLRKTIIPPLTASVVFVAFWRGIMPPASSLGWAGFNVAFGWVGAELAFLICSSELRRYVKDSLMKYVNSGRGRSTKFAV